MSKTRREIAKALWQDPEFVEKVQKGREQGRKAGGPTKPYLPIKPPRMSMADWQSKKIRSNEQA